MVEGSEAGGENGENREERRRGGKLKCTKKITPKRNRFGIWGRQLGDTARVIHFRKLFQGRHFHRR